MSTTQTVQATLLQTTKQLTDALKNTTSKKGSKGKGLPPIGGGAPPPRGEGPPTEGGGGGPPIGGGGGSVAVTWLKVGLEAGAGHMSWPTWPQPIMATSWLSLVMT